MYGRPRIHHVPSEDLLAGALPVGRFVHGLRRMLQEEPTLQRQVLRGEVGRWTRARSGHVYLTLRDDDGSMDAVMWSSRAPPQDFEEGAEVIVLGSVDVYPPRGQLQLSVERIFAVDRLGDLEAQRRRLIEALRNEGALDRARRPLPFFPKHVAVVIGAGSAAEADVLRLSEDRWPGLRRTVIGVLVQGEGAEGELVRGLEAAAAMADPSVAARQDTPPVDVIIVGRGGGSTEDLWAFNLEAVARAVLRMPVPVISAVGHEVDVVVTDLVADIRASTPSDAVERLLPVRADLVQHHDELEARLSTASMRRTHDARQGLLLLRHRLAAAPTTGFTAATRRLDALTGRLSRATEARLRQQRDVVSNAGQGLKRNVDQRLAADRARLAELDAVLRSTDPRKVMERGYGMLHADDGRLITSVTQLRAGDALMVHLGDGQATTTVDHVKGGEHDG